MSQSNTWSPTTGTVSGLQLTTNYNDAMSAIQSQNSGATAPANDQTAAAVIGQWWLDTSASPHPLREFAGAPTNNWVIIGWLDTTNGIWQPNNAGGTGIVASATTTDLGSVNNDVVAVSGVTTITGFGTTALTGTKKHVNFTGASLTLTHNATSLILPNNGSNIATAQGDCLIAEALGSGNWRVISYQKADGSALSANANLTQSVAFTGVITPSALSAGNNNDWAPTGLSTAETIRATPNASNSVITGLTGGASGRQITIQNISTSAYIVLTPNDTNSSAANRFEMQSALFIRPDQSVILRYDNTTTRWRVVGAPTRAEVAFGGYTNLKIVNDSGAPTTTVDVTADALIVASLGGNGGDAYRLTGVSVAPVMTSSGANGLDTGAIVNNVITWYAVWVIYNPTAGTVAGLYSLASTLAGITLPSGYTFGARVGWVRTDGAATARWMRQQQIGRTAQYALVAASNTTAYPIMGNANVGIAGWTAIAIANFVPTTASKIMIAMVSAASKTIGVSPNNVATVGAAPGTGSPLCFTSNATNLNTLSSSFILEGANIYYESNDTGNAVLAVGWEDNL